MHSSDFRALVRSMMRRRLGYLLSVPSSKMQCHVFVLVCAVLFARIKNHTAQGYHAMEELKCKTTGNTQDAKKKGSYKQYSRVTALG